MARPTAVEVEKKATLWDLITSFVGYCAWFLIWVSFFWIGMLDMLRDWGFNQVPTPTSWGVFIVATIVSMYISCFCSRVFTSFKKWAKKTEL